MNILKVVVGGRCRSTLRTFSTACDNNDLCFLDNDYEDIKEYRRQYYLRHKQSIHERHRQYHLKNKQSIMDHQKQFYKDNQPAIKERYRLYRLENREVINERQRIFRMKHHSTLLEMQRQSRLKNRDAIKEQQRLYRLVNKQTLNERQRQHYVDNRTAVTERNRLYRDKNRKAIEQHRRHCHTHNPKTKEQQRQHYLENKEVINELQRLYRLENKDLLIERQRLYRTQNREILNHQKRQYYYRQCEERKNKKWTAVEPVRSFFECVRGLLHVVQQHDWYRISATQINEVGGGGLFGAFANLGRALLFAYPEYHWDLIKFSNRKKKSAQRWLRVLIERLLPEQTEIFEDFLHPDLLWDTTSKMKMELDIWVPNYKLAVEYQGEQHYVDQPQMGWGPTGTLALYTSRDLRKKQKCAEVGITLIAIPYWWDRSPASLASTLRIHFPHPTDMDINIDDGWKGALPIPTSPPSTVLKKSPSSILLEDGIGAFLMHAREWDREQDPTGWLLSEKSGGGLRAFWDGSMFFGENGKRLVVPLEFTCALPKDVSLDGKLWIGHSTMNKSQSILPSDSHHQQKQQQQQQQDIQFLVFDAPMYPGYYLERHSFASNSISGCGPNIRMIPIQHCSGQEHLQSMLHNVSQRNGEGIILHHPEATYTSGRTTNLFKVKGLC